MHAFSRGWDQSSDWKKYQYLIEALKEKTYILVFRNEYARSVPFGISQLHLQDSDKSRPRNSPDNDQQYAICCSAKQSSTVFDKRQGRDVRSLDRALKLPRTWKNHQRLTVYGLEKLTFIPKPNFYTQRWQRHCYSVFMIGYAHPTSPFRLNRLSTNIHHRSPLPVIDALRNSLLKS